MKHRIYLLALLLITFGIRCGHLLVGDKFYVVNPDSFWFQLISKQDDVSFYQTGLAALYHYTGYWGEIFIPPAIGVATAILIYILASKMFSKQIGLFSVGFFALFQPAFIPSISANLDRDNISIFLITLALVVYAYSKTWKGALYVAAISLLVYLEWMWIGVVIIAGIIFMTALVEYWQNRQFEHPQVLWTLGGLSVIVVPFLIPQLLARLDWILTDYRVSEMTPLNAIHLWPYVLLIPFPIAFSAIWLYEHKGANKSATEYQTIKGLTFLFAWCAACMIMGLAAYRLAEFMIPSACIIAGVGFSFMLKDKIMAADKRRAAIIFTVFMILLSATFAFNLPDNMVMPNKWVDAMTYMREETPESSRVITWWDYGYWVEDVGERTSLVDGSHVRSDLNKDVAILYCAGSDSYAVAIMAQYDIDYLVFSELENKYFTTIESKANQKGDNGLYQRSRDEDFVSDDLEVVYRNSTVWIMKIRCAQCGNS